MVQQIEAFGAELQSPRLAQAEAFEQRQIDILNAWPPHHVSSFVSELAGLRHGVELLEWRTAHPFIRCVRLILVWIRYQIRAARIKSRDLGGTSLQRHIRAVVDRERRTGGKVHNRIQL